VGEAPGDRTTLSLRPERLTFAAQGLPGLDVHFRKIDTIVFAEDQGQVGRQHRQQGSQFPQDLHLPVLIMPAGYVTQILQCILQSVYGLQIGDQRDHLFLALLA